MWLQDFNWVTDTWMRKDLVIRELCEVPGTVAWHSEFHKGETSSPSDLFPPSSDDEHKYRPSLSIQRSRYQNMHGNLSSGSEVYGIVPTGAARGTQECPERGTSAALHRTLLPQSASGTINLAHVPPGPGGGGSKGDCWGGVLGKPYPNYQKRNICLPNHIWNIHFCFNALGRKKKQQKW